MGTELTIESFLKYESYDHESWDELIDGKIIPMTGVGRTNHAVVRGNLLYLCSQKLQSRKVEALSGNLFIAEANRFVPDLMIVSDGAHFEEMGAFGTPDIVAEVLMPWSIRYDRGRKKEVYEENGLREYWILDPVGETVEQYALSGGRLRLVDVYFGGNGETPRTLPGEYRETKGVIQSVTFPELALPLNEIFNGMV